ncbi:MAG: wax ester/triacylglycerol synthase family O-acyltransferase [Actinomycetota bacterium]
MPDRLSHLDVSFLHLESPSMPMHVGGVAIFEAPARGFDYEAFVELIRSRIPLVPRYRQKVRWVPGGVGNPVWIDDSDFDLSYHVRRSALPKPGTDKQLKDFVARVQSRPLDRARPLWEIYVIEGLAAGRLAVMTKTHHAMVDGIGAIDMGQVILDASPDTPPVQADDWTPEPEPSGAELVTGVLGEWLRKPTDIAESVRAEASSLQALARRTAGVAGGLFTYAVTTARSAPETPWNVPIGQARRFAMASSDLDDYKRIRKTHGGTVNDVVLATVAGALRAWMQTRGENVASGMTLRAMVPVSVRGDSPGAVLGNRVSTYFVDLPVGESNAVIRLSQVTHSMTGLKESGQSIGAEALIGLGGFAPPTLVALGARAAAALSKRLFNVIVTNVPGPQIPLYAAGARMLEMYPVVPLVTNQALAIGLASYNGGVFFGINADRDVLPDVDVLATCMTESLAELLETVR